jgi:dienelactone hydrolase
MQWLSMNRISAPLFALFLSSCGSNSSQPAAVDQAKDTTVDTAAATAPSIKTAEVEYTADGLPCRGFVAYDENHKGKLPIVVVVHEWWGLTDYVKDRARQLAALGYFAMDADMFGNGKTAPTPTEAMAMTKPYYTNPAITKTRLEAAIAKAKTFPQADSSRVAAMGYCFGGFVVLNAAKLGAPLKGTVSFHGDLSGVAPQKGAVQGRILICQGGDDPFVPEKARAAFKKTMDSAGVNYTFKTYPGALHAFTNPGATELGKKFKLPIAYNATADSASWNDMKSFFDAVLK